MDQTVIGRRAELARIDAFLDAVPSGTRVLVVEGEPGMGKTTLWLEAVSRAAARGCRVLVARPSGAEATFAYAAIGDLLEPVPDELLDRLPGPQARALRVALLREAPGSSRADGPGTAEPRVLEPRAPEPRAVAVALLNLLRVLAGERPLLVAVDDVQWLDAASAVALGFAVRRLRDEPAGFLLARRVDGVVELPLDLARMESGDAVERLAVGPMDLRTLGRLFEDRLGLTLPRETVRRIHGVSGGNPFYALELARSAEAAGGPLPDSLRHLVGERIANLPADAREALAIAAALASGRETRVAEAVGVPVPELERRLAPALETGVIELRDGRLRFVHPLLRTALWEEVTPGRRREIHARLATIVADPEERARHLALSADGPDEAVAAALEEASVHARARGAPIAAADLAGLARGLTPPGDTDATLRRGLAEAEHALVGGDAQRARSLSEQLLETAARGRDRARVLLVLAIVDLQAIDLRAAVTVLHEALAETDDERIRMRCEGVLTAALDDLEEDVSEALAHGLAELRLAERVGDRVHEATALRGIARTEQRLSGVFAAQRIERAMALEPVVRAVRSVFEWPSVCLAEMRSWTDDVAGSLELWEALRQAAAERGEEPSLSWILARMSGFECVIGRFDAAQVHVDEGLQLALGSDHPVGRATMLAARAFLRAHTGDLDGCRRDADGATRLARASGAVMAERTVAWALGLLELSLGDAAAAHVHLGPLVAAARDAGIREPGALRFVPDEAEALVGIRHLDEAEALLDAYTSVARSSGRLGPWAAADRARGLLLAARGDGQGAVEVLEASRALYEGAGDPFGLGRTLLALGAAERRALRRRDARTNLAAAISLLDGRGAARWVDAARRELAAISGRQAGGRELTAAERRVAELVAEGRTNREVAAALYLTERTVESHLSRVYAKLGVRSRAALAAAWAAGTEADPPTFVDLHVSDGGGEGAG